MSLRRTVSSIPLIFLLAATACSGTTTTESTGQYIDSAVVSTKVRAAIAKSDKLSIFPIDVTTFKGEVQLSGFVDSAEQKRLAGQLAANVEGVRGVQNDLVVKHQSN